MIFLLQCHSERSEESAFHLGFSNSRTYRIANTRPQCTEGKGKVRLSNGAMLRLTYCYHDVDIVELKVSAWNGSFGGLTRVYVGQGDLADTATLLHGFPIDPTDKREFTFGAFGSQFAGGAMEIRLSCSDGAGHARVDVTIEADYEGGRELGTERVELTSMFEPAALDQFVEQMRVLSTSLTGSAVLALA